MSGNETPIASEPQDELVKNGKVVLHGGFKLIKAITAVLALLLLIDVFYSLKLFVSAIKIRSHIGYFINMVSSGDGDILPSYQAVPVLFFLVINFGMAFCLFKCFDDAPKPHINRIMFILVMLAFALNVIIVILIFCVIAHANSSHESLHDGIVKAMNNYSSSPKFKRQMDMLQIEFQCCGSKKYDEWYTIKWFDTSLEESSETSMNEGNTPFSCCSIHSLFPCIHHDIEITGKAYQYTPEFNLSVSTRGCYEMIREKKQSVGWTIVLNLLLFILFESSTTALLRFVQTAHCINSKFVGNAEMYTMWLIGSINAKKEAKVVVPSTPASTNPSP